MSTNLSTRTVRTSNFTPNGTSLGTVDGFLGTVDECNTFSEVRTSFGLSRDVFEFEDGSGGGLSVFGATVSHVTSLNKESKNEREQVKEEERHTQRERGRISKMKVNK